MKDRIPFTWLLVTALTLPLLAGIPPAHRAGAQEGEPASPSATMADLSDRITYQGRLMDGGSPANGGYEFKFELYDAETGGFQVGETLFIGDVTATDGYVRITTLDFGDLAYVFNGQALWLEISVRPKGGSTYTKLSPRQAITAAPYAHSLRPGAQTEGTVDGPTLYVRNFDNGGLSRGVEAWAWDTGVLGYANAASGHTAGVYGVSFSEEGKGVFGWARATTGATSGVFGQTDSVEGYGVYGMGPQTGMYAEATATDGFVFGVFGKVASSNGTGVYGWSSAVNGGTGVTGVTDGILGTGIKGLALATTGTARGVWGESDSVDGTGVTGLADATSGETYGVYGKSRSPDGYGGSFENPSGGVALQAVGSGQGRYKAALRVDNTHPDYGMAAYLTNDSQYATAHFSNDGAGEVLYLTNSSSGAAGWPTAGGDYIVARSQDETRIWFRVDGFGNIYTDGVMYPHGADMAEMLPAAAGPEPGDVLVIGADGLLARSTEAYQSSVVGVYSTEPGFVGGQPIEGELEGHVPLAVTGIVPVKVTAENGPIVPGTLLVTSSTPAHAMRAGEDPPVGTVIGKALSALDGDAGVVQMLVMLR